MAEAELAIFTNMCMVYDNAGNVLVQDRTDPKWPGIVFPGGHVEAGESFTQAVIREVYEETGLTIVSPELCGVKQFQTGDARYIVLLYKADQFSGELRSSEEGEVFWVKRAELEEMHCARDFLPMVYVMEQKNLSEVYYVEKNDHWCLKLI